MRIRACHCSFNFMALIDVHDCYQEMGEMGKSFGYSEERVKELLER